MNQQALYKAAWPWGPPPHYRDDSLSGTPQQPLMLQKRRGNICRLLSSQHKDTAQYTGTSALLKRSWIPPSASILLVINWSWRETEFTVIGLERATNERYCRCRTRQSINSAGQFLQIKCCLKIALHHHHVGPRLGGVIWLSWVAHFQIIYLIGLNTTENHRKHETALCVRVAPGGSCPFTALSHYVFTIFSSCFTGSTYTMWRE